MSYAKKHSEEVIGQDSFLDVVANLVGILIIFIMIVGSRAKEEVLYASTTPDADVAADAEVTAEDVAAASEAEKQVESDIHRVNRQMKEQDMEVAYREAERDRAQLLVEAAKRELAARRGMLDDRQREQFDQRSRLAAAQTELAEMRQAADYFASVKSQPAILEHLPTPMAKTVFGKELHFRLSSGRLTHIPWDDFIQLLKVDMPKNVWRLKDQDEYSELLGPMSGFWMRYTLKRNSETIPTKVGVAVQQTVELQKFVLIPEAEGTGERMDEALRDGSQLYTLLAKHRPDLTTITVWTYPDSFNEFRQLKRALFERGYVTAARPIPAGHPIGGSPQGTRSAAQ